MIGPSILIDLRAGYHSTPFVLLIGWCQVRAPINPGNTPLHDIKHQSRFGLAYDDGNDRSGHESNGKDLPLSFLVSAL